MRCGPPASAEPAKAMAAPGNPPKLLRDTTGLSEFSFEDVHEDLEVDDGMSPSGLAASSRARIFNTLEEMRAEQTSRVEEAVECANVSIDDAWLMLRRHGWEVTAFTEAFFEDSEAERRRAGTSEPAEGESGASGGLCGICFAERGQRMLPCESLPLRPHNGSPEAPHPVYCRECWRQYLGHAVHDGKGCLDLRCPAQGCAEAVRPTMFDDILEGSSLKRYLRFQAESFVDDSRGRARWCPGVGCSRAAWEPTSGQREVECPCGMTWCFGCGTDFHLPVACETVRRWEEKNRDEGEDATWIRVNTKLCPKCENPIEKNGGCMHMTCRKPGGCGHEFCWICMKAWAGHSACNAKPESQKALDATARAKSELMRYAHFYERYVEHHKAQQFAATEQLRGIEVFGSLLVSTKGVTVTDAAFLVAAVAEIRDSRRFLKWTYAYAYFAKLTTEQRNFFEFHQSQLEGTLERLSDIMENTQWDAYLEDLEEMTSNAKRCKQGESQACSLKPFPELRAQLISLTGVVHDFFSHLRQAIEQGTLFGDKS